MAIRPETLVMFLGTALVSCSLAAQETTRLQEPVGLPRVAVVLGGGGAHGVAHLGVLQELERQRIPIHFIAGTGLGGVIAGLYASGMPLAEVKDFLFLTDWDEVFNPDTRRQDLSFRRKRDDQDFLIKYRVGVKDGQAQLPSSLAPNDKLARLLQAATANTKGIRSFDDLPIPFRTVAMDLVTGDEVVLGDGALDRAMLATLAVPGTLPPVKIGNRLLITGSLLNNLPIDVAQDWGADVTIVVDVGPYTRPIGDLNSVFEIFDQVGHLLQNKNSSASVALLRNTDILIKPDLGPANEIDFSDLEDNVRRGSEAVQAIADRLVANRMDESDYDRLTAKRLAERSLNPIIRDIQLKNTSTVADALILAQLSQPLDARLDKQELDNDLRKIYGIGAFSAVNFEVKPQDDGAVLEIQTFESRTGNRFWRFGISLVDDLEGNSAYTGSASLTWTQLNRLGGEWRNVFRIGERQQLFTEFYQPINESGRYFLSVGGSFGERNVNVFDSGEIIGQFRVRELAGLLSAGRIFGNSGELRLGLTRGSGTARPNIGSNLPSEDFDVGGVSIRARRDTLDNVYFPKRGVQAELGWTGQRESLGSSSDFDIAVGRLVAVKTWGAHSVLGGIDIQTQLKDAAGAENLLTTGGLFRLSGFQRDELTGRHTAVGRVIYYRQVATNPLRGLLDATLFVGGSLELGNAWQNSSEVSLGNALLAGSVFLGADTFVGPVYLGAGKAEGGNSALYLFIGRPF